MHPMEFLKGLQSILAFHGVCDSAGIPGIKHALLLEERVSHLKNKIPRPRGLPGFFADETNLLPCPRALLLF